MKKILCLIDGLTLGGAERQLIGLAYFLKQKGYDTTITCYHENNFYKTLLETYNLKCITLNPKGRIEKIFKIGKFIKNGNFDCVIAYKDGATMIACILKLLGLKCKIIVSERNTTQRISKYERIKFNLYRFSDFVVPNSFSQEEFIKKHFPFLNNKIVTITNFTDTYNFVPSETSKDNKTCILLIAARIAKQKNILRFLAVVKRLKDLSIPVSFKWIGNVSANEEDYAKEVVNTVQSFNIKDLIEFYPATNNIKEEYQSCDALCLPSLYEGYPNVICEAMSCGKPILCSNICDNSFIVKEGINGFLFNPYDINDIADTIKRFINLSQEERRKMGQANRTIAVDKFSKEHFVNKYINLINAK